MEDYQKSLEALQIKLAEKEKALQDSQDEVSRVDKRADDFKTQIGKRRRLKTRCYVLRKQHSMLQNLCQRVVI